MSNQTLSIQTPLNFNFEECLWFLDRNYDDCLHKVNASQVIKVIEINNKLILVSITVAKNKLQIKILNARLDQKEADTLKQFIVDWFDLDKNLQPFYELLEQDQRLRYMITQYRGLRLIGIPNLFEAISWAIIGQQINLSFAYKLKRRLVEKYGSSVNYEGSVYHVFPDCKVLAAVNPEDLKEMQFSRSKATYLLILAKAFASDEISKEKLLALPDLATRQKVLVSVKGIGIWTANYALMKSLKAHSCIPYGDAGLLNSLLNHNLITDKKQHKEIERFFYDYPGWESYLVFYLWRSLSKM